MKAQGEEDRRGKRGKETLEESFRHLKNERKRSLETKEHEREKENEEKRELEGISGRRKEINL